MQNLLEETKRVLAENNQTLQDIVSVQGKGIAISIDRFIKLANVLYDDGYGAQEVAADLVLIMNDGSWYERSEYDGSEWWARRKCPDIITLKSDDAIKRLVCTSYSYGEDGLEAINAEAEEDES